MPETMIRPALPAQELAGPLIEEHHPHLANARILWLFTTAKRKKANRVVLGTAARLGVLQRYLSSGMESIDTGYDFMILLSDKHWAGLKPAQRLALVDHCLCRCGQRETVNRRTGATTTTWCTLAPDVEEFSAVVERHGLWLNEQKAFVKRAGRQLALEDEPEHQPPPKERVTTVEPDGIVASTETLTEAAEHERKNAETVERLQAHASVMSNGTEHAEADWRERTAIGTSEHAQRRRSRARS